MIQLNKTKSKTFHLTVFLFGWFVLLFLLGLGTFCIPLYIQQILLRTDYVHSTPLVIVYSGPQSSEYVKNHLGSTLKIQLPGPILHIASGSLKLYLNQTPKQFLRYKDYTLSKVVIRDGKSTTQSSLSSKSM